MNTNEEELENVSEKDVSPVIGSYADSPLLSEIIAEAELRAEKEAAPFDGDGEGQEPEAHDGHTSETEGTKEKKPEITAHVGAAAGSAKKGLAKVTKKIMNAEVLKPEVIKDMFFGSVPADNKQMIPEDEPDEEEAPVLFDKARNKRITADPNQDKMIFSVDYMVTPDQAADGYMLFYNEFIRRSNFKVTAVFGLLSIAFLVSVLIAPSGYLNYLLLLISLSVIAMKWINSSSAKRDALMSADDVKNDSYKLDFYNSRILLQASELAGDKIYNYPPVMIRFEDIELKVIDCDEIYVLIFRKDYIYTVPKTSLTPDQNNIFRTHLISILGDDYYEYK